MTLTKLNEDMAAMKKTCSAPTVVYPSSDGEPMAETERHRKTLEEAQARQNIEGELAKARDALKRLQQ